MTPSIEIAKHLLKAQKITELDIAFANLHEQDEYLKYLTDETSWNLRKTTLKTGITKLEKERDRLYKQLNELPYDESVSSQQRTQVSSTIQTHYLPKISTISHFKKHI